MLQFSVKLNESAYYNFIVRFSYEYHYYYFSRFTEQVKSVIKNGCPYAGQAYKMSLNVPFHMLSLYIHVKHMIVRVLCWEYHTGPRVNLV